MGSSIYFLGILLLAIMVSSTTGSGLKATDEFDLEQRLSSRSDLKCEDGYNCADIDGKCKLESTVEQVENSPYILRWSRHTRQEHNKNYERIAKNPRERKILDAGCVNGKCILKEIAGVNYFICNSTYDDGTRSETTTKCQGCGRGSKPDSGSVKIQVTGYMLYALTIMVIFLPSLLGFFGPLFGPESSLPMEQCCCGKEKAMDNWTSSTSTSSPYLKLLHKP